MSIDADEFYRESELSWAKKEIEENGLDATAVRYMIPSFFHRLR
jgi:hypothetical protein